MQEGVPEGCAGAGAFDDVVEFVVTVAVFEVDAGVDSDIGEDGQVFGCAGGGCQKK